MKQFTGKGELSDVQSIYILVLYGIISYINKVL